MRTRNLKRLLSLALCLCMVTGLLPVTALAAELAITTETLAEATVGVYYETTLTATASDRNGQLAWSSEDLPGWLTLTGNADGTAALTGTPGQAGKVTFTVTVKETIPAAEPEEPAEEPAAEEGETPAGAPQPTVLTASKEYTLTVAAAPANEPADESAANAPLTNGGSLRSGNTMSAEIYTGQDSYGGFTGETSTFAVGDTVILHSYAFSPALAPGSEAISIGILPTSVTDPNMADIFWFEESGNGTISNKPENNVLQLIDFQLDSNVSPGTYKFVIWAAPTGQSETVYTSTETFTITEGEGTGTGGSTATASDYTASFATDKDFTNPVTSLKADGTQYYFKASEFSQELTYTLPSTHYYQVTVRTTTGKEILISGDSTVSNTNGVIQSVRIGPGTVALDPGSYTLVMDIYSVSKSTGESEQLQYNNGGGDRDGRPHHHHHEPARRYGEPEL